MGQLHYPEAQIERRVLEILVPSVSFRVFRG